MKVFDLSDKKGLNTLEHLRFIGEKTSHPRLEKYVTISSSTTENVFFVVESIETFKLKTDKCTSAGEKYKYQSGYDDINNYSIEVLINNAESREGGCYKGILKSTIKKHTCSTTIECPSCKGDGKCNKCKGDGHVSCKECNGTGICNNCEGKGIESCPDCGGDGVYECEHCEGDGYFECDDCDGTGTYNHNGNYTECRRCHGTGKLTCQKCGGAGEVTCNNCDGDGTITCRNCDGDGVCPDCEGSGRVVCERCDGSGSCAKCNGTGQIVCPRCGGSGCYQSYMSYTIKEVKNNKESQFPSKYQNVISKIDIDKQFVWSGKIAKEKGERTSDVNHTTLKHTLADYFDDTEDVIKYVMGIRNGKLPQDVVKYQNTISVYKTAITQIVYSEGKKKYSFFLVNNNKQIVIDTDNMPPKFNIARIKNIFSKIIKT